MKKSPLIAAAALLMAACGCNRYQTVKNDPLDTKIYTLDNGLKVFMSVNKEQPRIQTYIAVKVGSKNDPSETTGLAHYFEHLMFKGSESFGTTDYEAEKPMLDEIEQLFEVYRKTTDEAERAAIYHKIDSVSYEASKLAIPNEYDKLMAIIGADGTNAWTSADETVYTEDIPSNQIDNWARIQADRFRNNVIRGFHTELETIYEEKNMSLTQDSRKLWEALDKALFPHHPYGQQTTLGSQEHLKNPSITNVKKYHDTYYVPNNIAICLSGDFNPDEMVATIEKYFGDWKPNPEIPVLQFEKEEPITTPVEASVYGLEAEEVAIAWRLPGANDLKTTAVADIAGSVLYNGTAGLIDLDINQQQAALGAYAANSTQPDYGQFIMLGVPKQGQSLEELKDILLSEIGKLRDGDFDESLIPATINNIKLAKMRSLEDNSSRAQLYVDAFINGVEWKDAAKDIERLEQVTKDDVVAFANSFLGENAYAVVYKRQGEDTTVQKISAPAITPIVTNRDLQSDFLKEIQAGEVKPIEPVFVDFDKDMAQFEIADGVNVLYKTNKLNDIATLRVIINRGTAEVPALGMACTYLDYLGTDTMSAEDIKAKMYDLACSYSVSSGAYRTTVSISGLSENIAEAAGIIEDLISNAKPDEQALEMLKANIIKNRDDNKKSQSSCYSALRRYIEFGPEYIKSTTLPNDAVAALTSDGLLSDIKDVYALGRELLYYGPMTESEFRDTFKGLMLAKAGEALPEKHAECLETPSSSVVMAQYDAKQIYYLQYSNRGEVYDADAAPAVAMYNEYFGGGMNTIVFQEMREARGLAYSAWARLYEPEFIGDAYLYQAFIATQNDKMRTAVEAFDDIINDMPESEAAFNVAKDAIISRLRTQRTTGMDVLGLYMSCRSMGLSEPDSRKIYEAIPGITMADIKATQEKWVKDRAYTYAILGDIKDLDTKYLATLGPVKTVSLEEIFGY